MRKALAFARLDFITVKPYFTLKNLVVIIAAPLFILLNSKSSGTVAGAFVIFAVLYCNSSHKI